MQILAACIPLDIEARNEIKKFKPFKLRKDIDIDGIVIRSNEVYDFICTDPPREKIKIVWHFKDQIEMNNYNVFTDGSKCNGRVGCGAVISYGDQIQREFSWRLNDEVRVFLAEAKGIKNSIIETLYLQSEINIYTDSRSVVQSLNSPWSQYEIIHEIKSLLFFLIPLALESARPQKITNQRRTLKEVPLL
ncbi:hypothetical protein AVEN_18500-1 [Araneus ventricosus]|uniref:RNase H type-1 domain-containing protein n=1 Tax=Araneus ventricosus TaxID=182803 RepID=A0A4Y2QEV2_ARAVE|nr:hypothetical protein AVEN_16753-1 [Araneus ventricosus]GBN62068.1 hypothetical protein AVEN_18500-1 [Araneus ventricosus]